MTSCGVSVGKLVMCSKASLGINCPNIVISLYFGAGLIIAYIDTGVKYPPSNPVPRHVAQSLLVIRCNVASQQAVQKVPHVLRFTKYTVSLALNLVRTKFFCRKISRYFLDAVLIAK